MAVIAHAIVGGPVRVRRASLQGASGEEFVAVLETDGGAFQLYLDDANAREVHAALGGILHPAEPTASTP